MLIYPEKLVLGRPSPDELNRGLLKLNVAFTLPPGSYATLVVRRLFPVSYREEEPPLEPAKRSGPPASFLPSKPLPERAKRPGSRGKRTPAYRL